MGAALEIRTDLASPAGLRRLARRERNPRTATRMLAIAGALEGMSRAEAARLAGMERQALRDAVVRYNAEGLAGLRDRPKPGRPPALTEPSRRCCWKRSSAGPTGAGRLRRLDPAGAVPLDRAPLRQAAAPGQPVALVRRLELSRQKTRPLHPKADEQAKAAFAKGGSRAP